MKREVYRLLTAFCFIVGGALLLAQPETTTAFDEPVSGKSVLPPPMSLSQPAANSATAGESAFLDDGEKQFTLFIPNDWKRSEKLALVIHFNGDPVMIIQQHEKHGLTNPLAIVSWGTGTETYRVPFKDETRLARWLKLTEEKLIEKGAPKTAKIETLDLSAYGGGYGAIREILKAEENVQKVRRLVLCDAMYASYSKEPSADGKRTLMPEHVSPWLPIIRAAAEGKKTFVFTFSEVVTVGYASCAECAETLAAMVEEVEEDSCRAANEGDFLLIKRSDVGQFHAWGYSGAGDTAHSVHVQNLGAIWKVLNEAGAP